jgi:hypothetical protein
MQTAKRRIKANIKQILGSSAEDKLTVSIANDVLSGGKCVAHHPLGI